MKATDPAFKNEPYSGHAIRSSVISSAHFILSISINTEKTLKLDQRNCIIFSILLENYLLLAKKLRNAVPMDTGVYEYFSGFSDAK